MVAYFNLNNSELSKRLLVNEFNMILDNHDRFVLNNQSIPSPQNESKESPGFVQKQTLELLCEKLKIYLKISQTSQESTSVGVFF